MPRLRTRGLDVRVAVAVATKSKEVERDFIVTMSFLNLILGVARVERVVFLASQM